METAQALKRFRKEFKLSQKDVAAVWGATPQTYQPYEYGDVTPSSEVIKKIAQAFNVTTDYLLGLSDDPRPVKYEFDTSTLDLMKALQKWRHEGQATA